VFEAASLSVYGRFKAAALCVRGCRPVCSRLQPCVFEAAAAPSSSALSPALRH